MFYQLILSVAVAGLVINMVPISSTSFYGHCSKKLDCFIKYSVYNGLAFGELSPKKLGSTLADCVGDHWPEEAADDVPRPPHYLNRLRRGRRHLLRLAVRPPLAMVLIINQFLYTAIAPKS